VSYSFSQQVRSPKYGERHRSEDLNNREWIGLVSLFWFTAHQLSISSFLRSREKWMEKPANNHGEEITSGNYQAGNENDFR
jgi:hypothetical protein